MLTSVEQIPTAGPPALESAHPRAERSDGKFVNIIYQKINWGCCPLLWDKKAVKNYQGTKQNKNYKPGLGVGEVVVGAVVVGVVMTGGPDWPGHQPHDLLQYSRMKSSALLHCSWSSAHPSHLSAYSGLLSHAEVKEHSAPQKMSTSDQRLTLRQ